MAHPLIRRRSYRVRLADRGSLAGACLLGVVTLAPAAGLAHPGQEPPARPPGAAAPVVRVRPQDDRARVIVADATQRSPTVAGLIEKLEATDVIVLVQTATGLPWPTGELRLVTRTPRFRFLLIRLETPGRRDDQIAAFAHELQHAVEIAEAPDVVDAETLARLYRRLGLRTTQPDHYESSAAIAVERLVAREVYLARRAVR